MRGRKTERERRERERETETISLRMPQLHNDAQVASSMQREKERRSPKERNHLGQPRRGEARKIELAETEDAAMKRTRERIRARKRQSDRGIEGGRRSN